MRHGITRIPTEHHTLIATSRHHRGHRRRAVPSAAQAAQPKPWPVIAFEGTPDKGSQVVVAGAYGHRQRRLTSGPNLAEQSRWSPFGKRILYLRRTPNERFDLMVMGAAGRDKHQLLSGKNRFITTWTGDPAAAA